MDAEHLKTVQRRGWILAASTADRAIARCPRPECGLLVQFREGEPVPHCKPPGPGVLDRSVASYSDFQEALRARRQDLGLTIAEVEDLSGMAAAHLAKAEKPDPSRVPTFNILAEWASSLGFEIILRQCGLPPLTLRYIADTREKAEQRRNRRALSRR